MNKAIRGARIAAKVLLLVPVLVCGLLVAVTVLRLVSYDSQRAIIRGWSRLLLAALGIDVVTTRQSSPEFNGLVVANHVSWLDAFVLGSVFGAKFVVRSDVAKWPVLGIMVKATGALFVDRTSPRSMQRSCHELADRLTSGQQFAVFPEGTTTNGREILAFRPNFFEASLKHNAPVTVVALRYLRGDGTQSTAPNYDGDITFSQSLLNVLKADRRIVANAVVTSVLRDFDCRKKLAFTAESAIRSVVCEGQLA